MGVHAANKWHVAAGLYIVGCQRTLRLLGLSQRLQVQ